MTLLHTYSNLQAVHEALFIPYGSIPPAAELIIARALAATQLDDVGGREAFDKHVALALQDVWQSEWSKVGGGSLGGLAKRLILERCLQDVSLRVKVIEFLKQHQEVQRISLPKIIVITGLPNSGTTDLRKGIHV
jgi:hypothetical protein